MPSILWRILIAVICVVLILAVLPPFFRILGFDPTGDVFLIIRICIAGLALFYVIKGYPFPPS